ncbi:MAG: hypothetical protein VX699_00800 [Myxococcota bacterium]|nr:hypothetical protein [Myxococcota bacterium]
MTDETQSPLWMVTQEPGATRLIQYLSRMKERVLAREQTTLCFSRSELSAVRALFAKNIRKGEAKLHRLCDLFCGTFFEGVCDMQSVVIGELPTRDGRFTLSQGVDSTTLYGQTDLALGNRLLERLRLREGEQWVQPQLVASFVEYQAHTNNPYDVHKMISRIKAEEEIWNKVCDEIFHVDTLVDRDKELRKMGRYIKDVFGVKLIVGDLEGIRPLHEHLARLRWTPEALTAWEIPPNSSTDRLRIYEVKDYLGELQRKQTGWEAIKLVAGWADRTFEIQIQSMNNYLLEREHLTKESHSGFKKRREMLRDTLSERIPLFGFYRDLLHWLFLPEQSVLPTHEGVTIELRD